MFRTVSATTLALLGGVPAASAASSPTALAPAGTTYSMRVTSSFKAPFTACWTFATNGRTIFDHTSLGWFAYQLTGLNTNANQFQAVWRGSNPIGFSGQTTSTTISGNGVDYYDRTYSFTGTAVTGCPGAAVRTRANQGFETR